MTRNQKTAAIGLTLTLAAAALTACSGPAKTTRTAPAPKAAAKGEAAPGQGVGKEASSRQEQTTILAGKVVETINAGSYTYLHLEKDGKRGWAAVPAVQVAIGDEVELIPGIDMGRFTSASLKRTFENIHFSAGLKQPGGSQGSALPPGHPKMPGAPAALPQGHPKTDTGAKAASGVSGAVISGKVVESTNGGGYTYLRLEKDGMKTWVALPETEVSVGSELSILPGNEMINFNSPSLKRSFDKIIFSSGLAGRK